MNKILFVLVIMLAFTTTGMAIAKEQTSEAKAEIPLNSTEYKGAELTFVVVWEGDNIGPSFIEASVDHFFIDNPRYYSIPIEVFFTSRTSLEQNVTQYLNDKIGRFEGKINKVSLRDIQFYQKNNEQNLQRQYRQYYNKQEPIIIYKESPFNLISHLLVFVAGLIMGLCIYWRVSR